MHRGWEISGYHDVQDTGVTEVLYGLVVGEYGPKIRQEFPPTFTRRSFPLLVLSLEFQSKCLAFRSPAIKTGNTPPNQASMSAPISGREGERYAARTFTGLPTSIICIAVASSREGPGTVTEW